MGDALLSPDAQAQASGGQNGGAKLGVPCGWEAVVVPGAAAVGALVCVPGGILAGLISDYTNGRATTCCVMLTLAAPMVCITSGLSVCAYAHLGTSAHVCLCVCVSLYAAQGGEARVSTEKRLRLRVSETD